MAAYAVIARIGRADPHLTVRDLDHDLDRDRPDIDDDPGRPGHAHPRDGDVVIIDRYDGATLIDRLSDQIAQVRESFGMMTFYLFDPESWRH